MDSDYYPYTQRSLWKGPKQYPYVLPRSSNTADAPYVPWNRGFKKVTEICVESPLPAQRYPCTCSNTNNRIPVIPTQSPTVGL